jgi:hypothetical protein
MSEGLYAFLTAYIGNACKKHFIYAMYRGNGLKAINMHTQGVMTCDANIARMVIGALAEEVEQ